MPRWYKRNPHAFRDKVRQSKLKAADVSTLSAILDFVGGEAKTAGDVLTHGGLVVDATTLSHATLLPIMAQRKSLAVLGKLGFIEMVQGEIRVLEATSDLIDIDDSALRQKRYRSRQALHDTSVTRDVTHDSAPIITRDVTRNDGAFVTRDVLDKSREDKKLTTSATPTASQAVQTRFILPEETTARDMLGAVWAVVQPHVHGITKTEWGKRNKRAALDMAKAGVSVEQLVAAHAELCEQRGTPIYTLSFVQEHIVRSAVPAAKARPLRAVGSDESGRIPTVDVRSLR